MKTFTQDELKIILEKHLKWLCYEPGGERANLFGANLSRANLSRANLSEANLSEANLSRANNLHVPMSCPEEGSFIGFKKVRDDYIVKLYIPADAKRSSATSRECRCDKALVLSIINIDGTEANVKKVFSKYDEDFEYEVGQIVSVDNFDDNRWNECAPGIHFFITRQEAVEYCVDTLMTTKKE